MKGIYVDETLAIPAGGELTFPVSFVLSNLSTTPAWTAFATIFDLVKINKCKFEIWLNDNSELTVSETVTTMVYTYDTDMEGRRQSYNNIQAQPDHHLVHMKPMQKYKIQFTPQFTLNDPNGRRLYAFNRWWDCQNMESATSTYPSNGFCCAIQAPVGGGQIRIRRTLYCQFKKRRVGTSYIA